MTRIIVLIFAAIGFITVLLGTVTFAMLPADVKAPEHPIPRPLGSHVLKTSIEWSDDPPAGLVAASAVGAPRERPLRVLMISMGGEYASYGAGMLVASAEHKGWLDFDIVTGVSAGSLLATLAFAHALHPDVMEQHVANFASAVEAGKATSPIVDGWRILLGHGSTVASNLEDVVIDMVDRKLVDKIAEQHRSGRRLFTASTDLTSGESVVWDIGLIAASDLEERVELIQSALLASMSVPVLFAPRSFGAHSSLTWHVDGGVMHPFFAAGLVKAIAPGGTKLELNFLMNGKLRGPIKVADLSPRADKVFARSLKLFNHAHWHTTLQVLFIEAAIRGVSVRVAAIPNDVILPDSSTDFEAQAITNLFREGLQKSRQAVSGPHGNDALWQKLTPKSIDAEQMLPETIQVGGPAATDVSVQRP